MTCSEGVPFGDTHSLDRVYFPEVHNPRPLSLGHTSLFGRCHPYVPVPIKLTFCGLPPPLSPIETLAERNPLAKGVNVTVIKQLSPAGTLLPQVLVSAKSLLSVPMIEIPVKFTATLPLLLSVILLERLLVLTG